MNIDNEQLSAIIKNLYEEAKTADPYLLESLKKAIKSNIPIGRRLNFASFLLSKLSKTGSNISRKRDVNKSSTSGTTLYLNIGKLGNVYRKHLVDLIQENSNVKESDLLNIRMHDRYSFITINESLVDSLIKDLSNKEFKNRKIVINRAKDSK